MEPTGSAGNSPPKKEGDDGGCDLAFEARDVKPRDSATTSESGSSERRSPGMMSGNRQIQARRRTRNGDIRRKNRISRRLLVIYGPDCSFKSDLLRQVKEEYKGTIHLPRLVTTMPEDHPNLGATMMGHSSLSVDTTQFERLVSNKKMVCYYHLFDSSCCSDQDGPASEGQCTSASLTSDYRDQTTERPCGFTRSRSAHNVNRRTSSSLPILVSPIASEDYQPPTLSEEESTCRYSIANDSAPPPADDQESKPNTPPEAPEEERRQFLERLVHPSLAVRNSAPVTSDQVTQHSSVRRTYYVGLSEEALQESFRECATSGGVSVLLIPELAARQVLARCSGRYPNTFLAAIEESAKDASATPIRAEHIVIDDRSPDAIKVICGAIEMVRAAPRYQEAMHAEALAFFQSRQFVRQHKAMMEGNGPVVLALNANKVRVDRPLKSEKDLVSAIAATPFKPGDALHMRIARTVYDHFTGFGGACPLEGKHWKTIGCKDDASPVRNDCGMLVYMHLLHLIGTEALGTLVHDIFQLCEGGKGFAFFPVVAKISYSVLQTLYTSHVQKLCNQRQQIIGVLNDIFVGACLKFFEKYQCSPYCPPDIKGILEDLDAEIRMHTRRVLMSVEGHQQGFSFHAQLSSHRLMDELQRSSSLSDLSLNRTLSVDTLNDDAAARSLVSKSPLLPSSAEAMPCPQYITSPRSLTALKCLGSTPNVFGL